MSQSAREKLESYCKTLDTQFFMYIFVQNRSFLDILQNCNLLRTFRTLYPERTKYAVPRQIKPGIVKKAIKGGQSNFNDVIIFVCCEE